MTGAHIGFGELDKQSVRAWRTLHYYTNLTGSEKIGVKNSDILYQNAPLKRLSKIFRGAKCLQCPRLLSDFFTAVPIEFTKPIELIEKILASMNFAY
jgi:hypothetical protein